MSKIEPNAQVAQKQDAPGRPRLGSRLATWAAAIALPILGLANLSEAVLLVEEGVDKVISTFTHLPEYDDLSYLKVGTTREFVQRIFSMPQVRKSLDDGLTADYYFDDKYLLTLFMRNDEVQAFTVISLDESFHPTVFNDENQSYGLGEFSFSAAPALPRNFQVDWTKTLGAYIEEVDLGLQSLGKNAFLGSLTYGTNGSDAAPIGDIYNARVLDEEAKLEAARDRLRNNLKPNLYGWGNIPLEIVRESVLSTSQFGSYISAYK
jgi:hypothetical protein